MGVYTDFKFLSQISSQLRNYKEVEQYKAVCSCPFCGDSRNHKWKARGNIFVEKGSSFYHCYNCSISKNFSSFLKEIDPSAWNDWRRESRQDEVEYRLVPIEPKNISVKKFSYDNMIPILNLPESHEIRQYVSQRGIPTVRYPLLSYTSNFRKLVEEVFPGKGEKYLEDERLVMPIYNQQNELVAFQGRSLSNSKIRYASAKSDDQKCFFGLERMNSQKLVFVTEGPIDSLFLPNAVAVCSADLGMFKKAYPDIDSVLVFDNEPRNAEIIKLMEKAIDNDAKICLWEDCPFRGKDINDFIKNGADIKSVVKFILDHSYKGARAKFKMMDWKKQI